MIIDEKNKSEHMSAILTVLRPAEEDLLTLMTHHWIQNVFIIILPGIKVQNYKRLTEITKDSI